ncbi:MAG: hypothetical protein QM727_12535 [Niabella sp.]
MNKKIALSLAVGAALATLIGVITAGHQYYYRSEKNRVSKKSYEEHNGDGSSYFKKVVPNTTYILLSFILGLGITYAFEDKIKSKTDKRNP